MLRLLRQKGPKVAAEARERVQKGKELVVKGHIFPISVMAEALRLWDSEVNGTSAPAWRGDPPGAAAEDKENLKRRAPTCAGDENSAKRSCNIPQRSPQGGVATPCRSPGRPAMPGSNGGNTDSQDSNPYSKLSKAPLRERILQRAASLEEHRPQASARRLPQASFPPAAPGEAPQRAASPQRARFEEAPRPPDVEEGRSTLSVRELKAALASEGIDFTGCVEKSDLAVLWHHFEQLRDQSLQELQDSCEAAGGGRPVTASQCARFLLRPRNQAPKQNSPPHGAAPAGSANEGSGAAAGFPTTAPGGGGSSSSTSTTTGVTIPDSIAREAAREADRILQLRPENFQKQSAWAFAVLDLNAGRADTAAVQRSFRQLMRTLHPDKAGHSAMICDAVDCARRARGLCERALSTEQVPSPPRALKASPISFVPGARRFELTWKPPTECERAPVRRYVVAVYDPGFGQPLTVASLEPDYNEEVQRFVGLEDLTRYVLSEQDLQKMPKVWTQASATVHVAAANETGQSSWAVVQVPLLADAHSGRPAGVAPYPVAAVRRRQAPPAGNPAATKSKGAGEWSAGASGGQAMRLFVDELQRRTCNGGLETWLKMNQKSTLQTFLRSVGLPISGSKDDLITKILQIA